MSEVGQFIVYRTEDGRARIECRFEGGSLWLSQAGIAELFQTTPQNVTQHLKAVYAEGELVEEGTCKPYLQVRTEGARTVRRQVLHYSLEAILAVGYRVRSPRGTQFRQWATERLREYLTKGFALDDERLKNDGQPSYFEELLARIRDIRSSEKVFYRKVLDIYGEAVDYDSRSEVSKRFFATVQNKLHWAAHGHTAAEVVAARADATKPNMGLTSFTGATPRRSEVTVAKNFLSADELDTLNRIVTAYLEFAELQAKQRKPTTMAMYAAKLDDFLRLGDREVLTHKGKVSQEEARELAEEQYDLYRRERDALPTRVDRDMARALEEAVAKVPRKKGKNR